MLPDNILFSDSLQHDLARFINGKNYSQTVVLVDENTREFCLPLLGSIPFSRVIEIQSGEAQKNLDTCRFIWEEMTALSLDRHALVLVLGGGVLGDMGGFCAATYKRGIDFILIPTTLLAQVDASIGGKLGIDFNHYKNHIGVFCNPVLTILHPAFLKTLPVNELRSGFAEVVKHCLIADQAMWKEISKKSVAEQDWRELGRHSVTIKARITTEDPTEKGRRKLLNAGHTIGHAIETFLLASGKPVLHGEAVAAGLIAEAFLAAERGLLLHEELNEISTYLTHIFGKLELENTRSDEVGKLALQDKKNKRGKILGVLLEGIGNARWDQEITSEDIRRGLQYYNSLQI